MGKRLKIVIVFLAFFACTFVVHRELKAQTPTFKFECLCTEALTGDSCDVCTPSSNITSRSFSGLMICRYNTGTMAYDPYKWIDAPYSIRKRPGQSLEFLEYGTTNPDKITISRTQTEFYTYQGFLDSTWCSCGDFRPLWYASDSTDLAPIYSGDTLQIVGWGATTVTFDSIQKKYIVYTPVSGGTGTLTNFTFTDGNGFNGTVTNPTTTPTLEMETTVTGIIYGGGGDLLPVTVGSGLNFSAPTLSAVDVSATNELQTLANTSTSTTHTATLSNSGGSLQLAEGTGIGLATTGTTLDGVVTITNTAPDQTVSITGAGINVVTGTYPNFTITGTEVDGSVTNEAQTLSVSGTSTGIISLNAISGTGGGTATIAGAGINTISQLSGTITITGTEVDGALANEGLLGVGAGGASSSVLTSNTAGATGVTVNVSTGLSISETTSANGGQITLTNTAPDQTVTITGGGINVVTGTYPNFTVTGTEVDGGLANEGLLGVGAGSATSSVITSNTTGATGVTINAGTGITISETTSANGGQITITNSSPATSSWLLGGNTVGTIQTIGTNDAFDFSIETGGTEKARVTTGGSLLVNVTSALARLHAAGVVSNVGILSAGGTGLASGTALYRGTGTFTSGFGYVFDGDGTLSGGNIFGRIRNGSNTASSQAIENIAVAGSTAGDPYTQYQVEGANTWSVGIDNSVAADPFKIARTTALGVSISDDVLIIETDGRASIGGIATIATTNLAVAGTGGIRIPAGNVAARPASTESIIRHNTQYDGLEAESSDGGWHLVTARTSPTVTVGAAMGTGGTVGATINGSYTNGSIAIQTGTTGLTANATIVTVNYPITFSATPTMIIDGGNPATMNERVKFYVSNNSQGSTIITANGTLTANTSYILWYHIRN